MSTETRLLVLEKKIRELEDELDDFKKAVADQYQTATVAATAEAALEMSIDAIETTLDEHDAKFTKVQLPAETQYYLTQNQITGLKAIAAECAALSADVKRQMNALIAAWKAFKAGQNS